MSIPGPAHVRGIAVDRILFAVTLGSQPICRDTSANQLGHYRIRAFLREPEIFLRATHIVGITGNLHVNVWILLESSGDIIEQRLGFRPKLCRSRIEPQIGVLQ